MNELEWVDYVANRLATGEYPDGVKYMFSSEDWLAFKDEVRRHDLTLRKALEEAIGKDEVPYSPLPGDEGYTRTVELVGINLEKARMRVAVGKIFGEEPS